MIKFLNRFFCRHFWDNDGVIFIDCGMGKLIYYRCPKCGKRRSKII